MNSLCIIDDDPIIIFGLKKMLSYLPIVSRIESYQSGAEAFKILKPMIENNDQNLPDVIFLDINMPIMDGWQFLEQFSAVKRNHPSKQMKLFLVSSSIDINDHKRAEEIEFVTGFITKPVTLDDLTKHLN